VDIFYYNQKALQINNKNGAQIQDVKMKDETFYSFAFQRSGQCVGRC
jgi:hypothetical protein